MNASIIKHFGDSLLKIRESFSKPRGTKKWDKVLKRIGGLQEKSHCMGKHYRLNVVHDESSEVVTALNWERVPVEGTRVTHPVSLVCEPVKLHWEEAKL